MMGSAWLHGAARRGFTHQTSELDQLIVRLFSLWTKLCCEPLVLQSSLTMCGIFGYLGPRQAKDMIVGGLQALEYRGYDSAGIAIREEGKP